jgi:hypothetical protein
VAAEAGIGGTAYYLPETTMTLDEWAAATFQPERLIAGLKANGASAFRIAGDRESVMTMAETAVARLFETHRIDPAGIGLILHVHTFRYSVPPPPVSLPETLRRRFGCVNALAASIAHQTCGSLFAAIAQAHSLMAADPSLNRVLLVTADRVIDEYTRAISDGLILSDSASALLIERDCPINRLGSFVRFTNMEHNPVSPTGHRAPGGPSCNGVLNHAKVGRRALALLGENPAGITLVIDINSRLRERRQTVQLLGLDPDLLYDANVGRIGHAFCSDFVINFTDAMADETLAGGVCLATASGDVGIYNCMTLTDIRATARS